MKRTLLITFAIIALAVIAAFTFDAMQPRKERRILVEENYVPPSRPQARPQAPTPTPAPAAQSDYDLTPMPE